MKAALKAHWAAVAAACSIGVLALAPYLYFAHTTPSYAGIAIVGADAEDHYTARVEEVYDGYPAAANTFLPEKNVPYTMPALGENMVAWVGKVLYLSAVGASLIVKFFFPFCTALLVYILLWKLFASRSISILGTWFAMLGDNLITGPTPWIQLLHGAPQATAFIAYSRPINPEVSSLFLFGGLLLIYVSWFKHQPRLWQSLTIGIITGLSLYVSPFIATFLSVVIGFSFLWFVYKKEWASVRSTLVAGVLAIGIYIPFLINYRALIHLPGYVTFAMRQGLIYGHHPVLSSWLVLLSFALLFAWPKAYSKTKTFFTICILALWVLTEQHIVTGVAVQPSHYHWYLTKPLVAVVLSMYVVFVSERYLSALLRYIPTILLCVALLSNAALTQAAGYRYLYPHAADTQRYAPALSYLRSQPHHVVWADPNVSMFIPMYTQDDTPNNNQVANYVLPENYLETRLFLNYRLRGVPGAEIKSTMHKEREWVSSQIYSLYWRQVTGSFGGIPDSILDSLANTYATQYANMPLSKLFTTLEVDTIIWDKEAERDWHIDTLPFVKQVYENGSLHVFTLAH